MSPNTCYYEVGIETKHVKLALKIPDLRSSKIKLGKSMKKPRTILRRKRKEKRSFVDTSSLASLNIDWRREFEDKYAELIDKTEQKKRTNKTIQREKFQQDLQNISLIANTSLVKENTKDLSLNETCQEEEDNNQTFADTEGKRNLLKPKKVQSLRRLRYSYHVLRNAL